MPKLTEQESTELLELQAQYDTLKEDRESIKWEISKLEAAWYEIRCQMEDIAHRIEDIQGEGEF